MNPLVADPPLAAAAVSPRVAPGDRVGLPDGRVGEVIGFYRDATEIVLVRLGAGDSERHVPADLRPLN